MGVSLADRPIISIDLLVKEQSDHERKADIALSLARYSPQGQIYIND